MNEKLMQDLLKKYPSVLIEEGLQYYNREITTGSRRLDLVFTDRKERLLLVEVQKGSLDTKHIDRHIDFVEGYLEKNPTVDVRLMYIANRIDYLKKSFLEKRGYEYLEVPEYKFLDLAEKEGDILPIDQGPTFVATKNQKVIHYTEVANAESIVKKMLSLFSEKKENIMTRQDIILNVLNKFPGTNQGSIIFSDYCYNLINRDSRSFSVRLFESLGGGKYRCLGIDFPYSGEIMWKEQRVGIWKDGKYTLNIDPRNLSTNNLFTEGIS